jgi:hypothetical protein
MRIKRFNEEWEYDVPEKRDELRVMGTSAWRSPITNSVIKLSLTENRDGKNKAIVIQSNEGGTIINEPAGIDEIIGWLMEYKDTMY